MGREAAAVGLTCLGKEKMEAQSSLWQQRQGLVSSAVWTGVSSLPAAVPCGGTGRAAPTGGVRRELRSLKVLNQVRRQLSFAALAGGQEE